MTLTEFLLARIAEDKTQATLVFNAPPKWTMTVYPHDGDTIPVEAGALHPRRVLAECEAKRRIVAYIQADADGPEPLIRDLGRTAILRHLALPYADHPDFDPKWSR